MRTKSVDISSLLEEHSRLLRLHGPDSDPVYEFEMRHLDNVEFLHQAVTEKRRLIQRRQEWLAFLWLLIVIAAVFTFQFTIIGLAFYRHFP